jgi:Transglutaminase-like superfamily
VTDYRQLLACSDAELARTDPLVMNLLVAKSIPSLADLDISRYERLADQWAEDVRRRLPSAEKVFRQTPQDWKNDVNFFRLGVLCSYLEHEAGIAYNEDQRTATAVYYTDPSDLFLNGVMDTRRGTCGNMAALHVAIGRRLGWPVSLAWVRSHYICRYDDGQVTHNIEATQAGYGGFKSDPDAYLIEHHELPPKAISSGSDLRAVNPREMLASSWVSVVGTCGTRAGGTRRSGITFWPGTCSRRTGSCMLTRWAWRSSGAFGCSSLASWDRRKAWRIG